MYLTLRNAPSPSFLRPVTYVKLGYAAATRSITVPRFLSQTATCRARTSSTTTTPLPRLHFPGSPRNKLALDPEAWANEFDRYLPHSLRKTHLDSPDYTNDSETKNLLAKIVCFFLNESRKSDEPVDFLTHVAVTQGRWNAVTWVVKAVTELKPPAPVQLEHVDPFSAIQWPNAPVSLEEATGQAIWAERAIDGTMASSINGIVNWFPLRWVLSRNGAIGRIWQSLGNMIAVAVRSPPEEKETIMSHVLEIIAYLHHDGVIPESVYKHVPPHTPFSLCQPPVLPLLAPRIFTAISDAAVRAQLPNSKSNTGGLFSFFGLSRPNERPAVRTTYGLGPEVWLELILWSCLRGPWITDGIEILISLKNSTLANGKKWSAIYWSDLAGQQVDDAVDITWQDKARFEGMRPEKADSDLVEGTVTVEVVAASIDALLNSINVGTKAGHIGWSLDATLKKLLELKVLLGRSNQGLIGATWDSVIFRLIEAGLANPDLDPQVAEKLLRHFAVTYPGTSKYSNAPQERPQTLGAPSYIMEPSAGPLGIFHSVIWSFIKTGDRIKAVKAVGDLVKLTDSNKRVVMERFFRNFRKWSRETRNTLQQVPAQFDSNLSRGPDPVLDPQFPPSILAALLGLARTSGAYKYGEWLLFSNDIDGPLIPERLYDHPSIAAEVIQFGHATGNQQLIVNALSRHSESEMSLRMIEALFETHMHQGNWSSVEEVLTILSSEQDRNFMACVSSRLAKRVLLLQRQDRNNKAESTRMEQLEAASVIFRRLVKGTLGDTTPLNNFDRFHGILSVLATVGPEWQTFCNSLFSPSLTSSHYRKIEKCIFEEDFRELVEGVAHSRGSWEAMRLVKMWCSTEEPSQPWQVSTFARSPEPWHYRRVLGPRPPPQRKKISVIDVSPCVKLEGRKPPASLPLLRIVYHQASREEEEDAVQRIRGEKLVDDPYHADRVEVWLWATRALRNTGMTAEEIDHELGPRPPKALAPMARMAEGDLEKQDWAKQGNADFEVSPVRIAEAERRASNDEEEVVKNQEELSSVDELSAETKPVESQTDLNDAHNLSPPPDQQQPQEQSQEDTNTTFLEQERPQQHLQHKETPRKEGEDQV